jgi:hypothetical protein
MKERFRSNDGPHAVIASIAASVIAVASMSACGAEAPEKDLDATGTVDDGVGAKKRCGNGVCNANESCVSCPIDCGACACTPTTCAGAGKDCGGIPDGCGGTLQCGTCIAPATCGGAGTPNVCGGGEPPPAGTALDEFDDFANSAFGDTLINRWQVPLGDNPWSSPGDTGTPWPSGGGLWEVATPQGPGFKFVVTSEMQVASGGKMGLIADIDHLTLVGQTEDWSGMFMLPSSGNTGFPPYGGWNCLWQWHMSNTGTTYHQLGVDALQNKLYVRSYDPTGGYQNTQVATAAAPLQLDHWYTFRIQVKWSSGADGFFRAWIDGTQLADWPGPTIPAGEKPYLQFGFYSAAQFTNEVWYAKLRKQ